MRAAAVPASVTDAFQAFPMAGCTPLPARAKRAAVALTADEESYSMWVAPTLDGGESIVVVGDGDARRGPFLGPQCGLGARDESITTLGAAGFTTGARQGELVAGRAPLGTEAVQIKFTDAVVTADVAAHGYFVVVHSRPVRNHPMWWFAGGTVTALDGNGDILARE